MSKTKLYLIMTTIPMIYSIIIVWGGTWIFWILTSRRIAFNEEIGPLIFCTLIAFLPYGAFVIHLKDLLKKINIEEIYIRLTFSQFIGMVASTLIWSLLMYSGYSNREGGADIGGAFIFMFISPLVVFQVMKIPFVTMKNKNKSS